MVGRDLGHFVAAQIGYKSVALGQPSLHQKWRLTNVHVTVLEYIVLHSMYDGVQKTAKL